ncbi:MAG: Gfo/Idh/MocA family oxidoreductase [Pirellulaceae bacterium]
MTNDCKETTRRRFLCGSAVAAGCFIGPGLLLGEQSDKGRPNDKLNIAGVGLGARGSENLEKCADTNIVALCDVDWTRAATTLNRYPNAKKFRDFRKMFDQVKEIDAVVISTPDHTHAVIAAEAMKRGKHVYVEAPLAHTIRETRELARLARETGVTTQMGNERHSGPGIRRAVEMIWGGGLGPIREVHCWTNRPQWPQGMARPSGQTAPSGLAWDLWLGPAPAREFSPAYHPYRWRGWLDFGSGALGAMGCHLLDVAFWGLKLDHADSVLVEAKSTGINGETFPTASTIRYDFPARGDLPPVTITWHDGGRKPGRPELLPYGREIGSNGILFMGEDHPMMFGPTVFGTTPGQVGPRTLPEHEPIKARRSYDKIPPVKVGDWTQGDRHVLEWIGACKNGTQPCASLDYTAPLTEMVLLGNVALVSGQSLTWDTRNGKRVGDDTPNPFIDREYREGWTL